MREIQINRSLFCAASPHLSKIGEVGFANVLIITREFSYRKKRNYNFFLIYIMYLKILNLTNLLFIFKNTF